MLLAIDHAQITVPKDAEHSAREFYCDLEVWRTRLQERGIKVSDQPPFPAARALEFRDPFGNRVEMVQYL